MLKLINMKRRFLASLSVIPALAPIASLVSCGMDVEEQIDISEFKSELYNNVITQTMWFPLASDFVVDEIFLLNYNGETDASESYRVFSGAIKQAPYNTRYEINEFTEQLAGFAKRILGYLQEYQHKIDILNSSLTYDKKHSLTTWYLNNVNVFSFTKYNNVDELLDSDSYATLNNDERYDLQKLGINNKSLLNVYDILLDNLGINISVDAREGVMDYQWNRNFIYADTFVLHEQFPTLGLSILFDDLDKYGKFLGAVRNEHTPNAEYVYVSQPGVVLEANNGTRAFFTHASQLNNFSVTVNTNVDSNWSVTDLITEMDITTNPLQNFVVNGLDGYQFDVDSESFVRDQDIIPFPSNDGLSSTIIKRRYQDENNRIRYSFYTSLEDLARFDSKAEWATTGIYKVEDARLGYREWIWNKAFVPGLPSSTNRMIILNDDILIKANRDEN